MAISLFKKTDYRAGIKYVLAFFCFILLNYAVKAVSVPISLSLLAALLFLEFNVIITPILYCASFLLFFNPDTILAFSIPALFLMIVFSIYKIFKLNMKAEYILYLLIAVIPYAILNDEELYLKLIICGILILLSLVFIVGVKAVFYKGLKYKFLESETAASVILIILLGLGLSNLISYEVYKGISLLLILICTFILTTGGALTTAIALSVTAAIYFNDLTFTGLYAAYGLICVTTVKISRYLSAFGILAIDFLAELLFNLYPVLGYYSLIATACAVGIYVLIPTRVLLNLKDRLSLFREKQLVRRAINRNRLMLSNRLYEIAAVFNEMASVFNDLKRDDLTEDKIKEHILNRILEEVCEACNGKGSCNKRRDETHNALKKLINIGLAKGKVSFIDMPKDLTDGCFNANEVIYLLNKLLGEYRSYVIDGMNADAGKKLIAGQASGIADVLKGLALETSQTLKYHSKLEKNLYSELFKAGYLTSELLIYGDGDDIEVSMLLPLSEVPVTELNLMVSRVIGLNMTLIEKTAVTEDKIFMLFKKLPEYDAVFGVATATKKGSVISGDTHSVMRISEGKFLVALSDGMGSGEYAQKVSDSALSLIESFYRSGMKSEYVLSTINKVLTFNTEDTFTALDISVIDLKTPSADFIKFGAPYGFIIGDDGIRLIDGNNLPLGILNDLKPVVSTTNLNGGDMLLLLSDGVTDAFGSSSELIDYLRTLPAKNPQSLAEEVLKKAEEQGGANKDDMTALALRIFKRVA